MPGLSDRHHDRTAARGAARRRNRRRRRSSSPSAPTISPRPPSACQPRRCRHVPERVSQQGLIARDPFVSIDIDGVGELMRIAAERGRTTRAKSEARHLRRAWRRPGFDPLLSRLGTGLCFLFALPRASCASRGGAGGRAVATRNRTLTSALTGFFQAFYGHCRKILIAFVRMTNRQTIWCTLHHGKNFI